jgi:hypothetical protein
LKLYLTFSHWTDDASYIPAGWEVNQETKTTGNINHDRLMQPGKHGSPYFEHWYLVTKMVSFSNQSVCYTLTHQNGLGFVLMMEIIFITVTLTTSKPTPLFRQTTACAQEEDKHSIF